MAVVESVASIAVAASGLVAAAWATAKWLRRPRFICGIPPQIAERAASGIDRSRLGHDSVATAFRHKPYCFAQRLTRPNRTGLSAKFERRLLDDRERARRIRVDDRGRGRIPILIANRGKRVADYVATVTLYADAGMVHVVDVVAETLPVSIYAERPELVEGSIAPADPRIVEAYGNYLLDDRMRRWGDVLAFTDGHLEASLFELVVVEVLIEGQLESFFVVYTLDCADAWTGARTFIQACHVERPDRAATDPGDVQVHV